MRRVKVVASEHQEQATVVQWCRVMASGARPTWPELALLFSIPNAGKRSWRTANMMRTEGLRSGVPDLCLPVPRGKYHGLFIELKRSDGRPRDVTAAQLDWLFALQNQGYRVQVCYGSGQAIELLTEYLDGGGPGGANPNGKA